MLNIQTAYRNTISDPVQNSFVQWLVDMQSALQDNVIKAREYYDGVHKTQLTQRMQEFLQASHDSNFTANYCPTVVNAKADRLKVTGFAVEDTQKEVIWDWWRKNRMDRKQGIVHMAATRDGDTFVLVEWDNEAKFPRFHFEPVYTGSGMMVYYSDEHRDEIEFASKTWQIRHGYGTGKKVRKNLYFPDRIEKYIANSDVAFGNWQPHIDETTEVLPGRMGMAGISWWTDTGTQDGNPLGVPVVHFKNNDTGDSYGTSDLHNVIPIQDAVNKLMIDLLAAADTDAFDILAGYGTDKWSTIKVGPGAIAAVNQGPQDAKLERVAGGSSTQHLLSAYNALVMEIARISGTPLSYFQTSGQVAAEGTMKQQEITLIARVEKAQTDYGNGWENAMNIARRLHNAFSDEPELDTDELIETIWEQAETRNDKEQAETLLLKKQLGVSEQKLQEELGYDADDIQAFARDKLRRAAFQMRQQIPQENAASDNDDADNETMTQTENADTPENAQAA